MRVYVPEPWGFGDADDGRVALAGVVAALIQVITSAPAIVAAHCGDVVPVPLSGRRLVLEDRLLGRFESCCPQSPRRGGALRSSVCGCAIRGSSSYRYD